MKFTIIRSKFIEGLASVQNIIAESHKSGKLSVLVEAVGDTHISSSAAFRAGLIEEYNTEHGCNCPLCGGRLQYVTGPDWTDVLVCDQCNHEISEELSNSKIYRVSERGIAEFIRKQLGLDFKQPMGEGNYRLGKLYGKNAFFCVSPSAGFYNAHKKDSVFILCDVSSVPHDWTENGCHAIQLSELFYDKTSRSEFAVAKDVLNDLTPKEPKRRFGKNRRINDRRDKWLTVISHILANGYRASDFHKGKLTAVAAYTWFKKVYPRFNKVARTLDRDMAAFHTVEKKKGAYDQREPVIAKLLETIADDSIPQDRRLEIANNIKNAVAKLKEAERRNGGNPVELPPTGWITDESGRSVAVPTTTDDATFDAVAMREKLKSLKITAA